MLPQNNFEYLKEVPEKRIILSKFEFKKVLCLGINYYPAQLKPLVLTIPNIQFTKEHYRYFIKYDKSKENDIIALLKTQGCEVVWKNKSDQIVEKKLENPDRNYFIIDDFTNQQIDDFIKFMERKRYSNQTIKVYRSMLYKFLSYCKKPMDEISIEDIDRFNTDHIMANKYSTAYQNQLVSAIKLFFKKQLNTDFEIDLIERPKKSLQLPKVINKEDVKDFLFSIDNTKHRTIFLMIYSMGLRIGEVTRLELHDIDRRSGKLLIRNGKGKKDRILPLSPQLIVKLDRYIQLYKPEKFLFEGQHRGFSLSPSTIRKVFNKKMGILFPDRKLKVHTLRHCFATHNLEAGVDLRYIQKLLGHFSSKTTEIYTHVSMGALKNIRNLTEDWDV